MNRIFDNPHQLPKRILHIRLTAQDDDAEGTPYTVQTRDGGTAHYVAINSTLSDAAVIGILDQALTAGEQTTLTEFTADRQTVRAEYLSTLATLQQIVDTASPTNAQVIAAVKFLAKTLRVMLKIFARMF